MNANSRALFISDCHLGAGSESEDRDRERRLLSFLEHEAAASSALFILGDLFDFWFEYRHAVPRHHFRTLTALRRLVEHGVSVTFVGGNHDFWAGSFLEREVGCRVHHEPVETEVLGRRLFLAHGDGLASGDRGYKALRALLRQPWAIAGYRWLHPDLGIPLARAVSRLSRRHRDETRFDPTPLVERVARPRYARGVDGVVMGHYHHPTHLRFDGADFVILGDWIENDTFAALEDGSFHLRRWRGERSESW